MAAETNEELFKKINALYAQFDAIRRQENVESARLALREEIIKAVCRLYFLRLVEIRVKKDSEANITAQDNAFYSAEIVEKTVECLKKFPDSDSCKNVGLFSKYVCASVSKMLAMCKAKETMSEKNAGKEISDCGFRLAKEIKKLDENLLKMGIRDENSRNERIARAKNLSVAEVTRYKSLLTNNAVSLNQPLDGDDEAGAELGDFIPADTNVEDIIFSSLELEQKLKSIDEVFASLQERTKPYLSALLTHRILTELENAKVDPQMIEHLLCGKRFASTAEARKVIRSFFSDGEFVRQEEVAEWFERDKTDASRTMKKFLEKLKKYERENVN